MSGYIITDSKQLLPAWEKTFTEIIKPGGTHSPLVNESIEWAQSPPILLPYQQRWLQDTSRIKICEKSRRIGLSWAEAADAVLTACASDGMNVFYCGFNYDMAYTFIRDCESWGRAFSLGASKAEEFVFNDEDKDILGYKIKFASGFEIKALSSKPTNFRSKQGKVILDEFAFHHDPEGLMKAVTALLMWGGKLVIISTHNGITSTFNELIQGCITGENDFSHHKITLADAIADGLYKRICMVSGQQWTLEGEFAWIAQLYKEYGVYASEELDCIPSLETDLLFNVEAVDRNACSPWQTKQRRGQYIAAIDPNFGSNDWHRCGIFDISKFPVRLAAEFKANHQSTIANEEGTIALIKEYNPFLIAIESNSGGKVISENLIRAMPNKTIEALVTTQPNKIVNTDRLARMVDTNEFQFPSDWAGVAEMKTFSKKLRLALVGHDDAVMMATVGMAFLQQAIENMPRLSRPLTGSSKIERITL